MVDTTSSIKNGDFAYIKHVLHGKDLLLDMNPKGNQVPSLKDGSIKEAKIKPCQNLSQTHSSSTHWRSNVSNRTVSQKGRQSRNSIVQRNELLLSQKTTRTREGSLPTRMLSQTKGRDQRRNAGTPVMPSLTTTLGPALLRMCTMDQHAKLDKQHKHQPSASQIGNKTARQKDQPHQSIRFTTILDGKLPARSARTNYGRAAQSSFPMEPTNVPSNQKAKTLMAYVSTSASSYSSSASQETSSSESEESIPSTLMSRVASSSFLSPKHDKKARISHERSMKGSRRMPTLDPPQHAGSMANIEKTDKRIGRLRRLKNKLEVIFHHHHHHHHHHHNGVEAEVGHTTLSNHHKSVGKYFQKLLHHKSKEGKVKSRLHSGCYKREADYGDGLIRHIWHSKKSKKSGGMKGLGKSHNHEMKVKKWHWWQNVSKRRGVVRQTNSRKRRFRLGLKAQKKHLRALKLN
ncbi:hypothetical protein FRX31_024523 [Thalictrum thalictroides]|uniref:Uncharacterized protein n=1 Tax=Thalictrum thalictroides TaxID=46969 RepID=A0A7J6VNG3_THATH|nr:hypothetical protein FRX31_024523 [Thalictrum thalictroides]